MKESPSFLVIFTARVVFDDAYDRALFEFDQREQLRFLIYRLKVVQAAMHRVERLRLIEQADLLMHIPSAQSYAHSASKMSAPFALGDRDWAIHCASLKARN